MVNKNSMTFNGQRRAYVVTLRGKRRPPWAPLTRNYIEVDGVAGAYLESTSIGKRIIEVPILIESQNLDELQKLKEDFADWIVTDTPKELIFDDEPDRMYYAMVDESFDMDEVISVGVGMLKFVCSDPFKYSMEEETMTFISDLANAQNNGTVTTYPTFTAVIKEPITHFDIVKDNAYMRIGQPYTVEEVPFEEKTLILNDPATSLVGWGTAANIDNGHISGTIITDGQGFLPSAFGGAIQPYTWQGPSLEKSLSQSLKDFQMDVMVSLKNSVKNTTGMIEIYALDSANKVLGKIGIEDLYTSTANTHGKAKVGDASTGKFFADEYATDNVKNWLDFKGVIRLTRKDNKWTAYFAVVDSKGKHINRRGDKDNLYFNDKKGTFGANVQKIQIAFRKMGGPNPAVPMRIDDIKVWRLNKKVAKEIPYIAYPNDVIVFDHKTNDIRINGESRVDLKDMGSSYFGLDKGDNPISFNPFDSASLTVDWRERFR